jgi:glucokinase
MILAGDIGGTKTLIGLFEPHPWRPIAVRAQTFPTSGYPGLPQIIEAFLGGSTPRPQVRVAAFGVAGPVIDQVANMTNVEWRVDADEIARHFAFPHVRLLNDLEAMAYAVPVLAGEEISSLQSGTRRDEGNIGLIAAGTGLGGALLHRPNHRYLPVASEIGHSDFPARTDAEIEFVRMMRSRFGRCEIEHVLCGPGLVNLAEFTHQGASCEAVSHADAAAEVSTSALEGTCQCCVAALGMFVDAYGAVAGNLALIGMTTGGLFVGGGIAPRILPALQNGRFMTAFRDKPPMRALLEAMPVHVILNSGAGLLGAAVYANHI